MYSSTGPGKRPVNSSIRPSRASRLMFVAEASFITASTFLVDGGISGAYVTPL